MDKLSNDTEEVIFALDNDLLLESEDAALALAIWLDEGMAGADVVAIAWAPWGTGV